MTTRPTLRLERSAAAGILAVVLFAMMALVVVNTSFGEMAGFPEGISVTKELGYAMFDFTALQSGEGAIADTEQFLIAFLLIAVVLDAALDASLVLAKREEDGQPVAALVSATITGDTQLAHSNAGGEPTADGGESASRGNDSSDAETEGENQ